MLLSQVLLLVVILIYQLYITIAHLLMFLNWFLSSPNKSCEVDPISIFLQKSCLHRLFVPTTKIKHLSLIFGVFSFYVEHAHVNPFVKKPCLPANELNSYRPISNQSFISELLEKPYPVVWMFTFFQSAYKQFYSNQTLYVILVLHLIAILISENIFIWHVPPASIIFVTLAVFSAIFIF